MKEVEAIEDYDKFLTSGKKYDLISEDEEYYYIIGDDGVGRMFKKCRFSILKIDDNVNHPAHYTTGKIEVIDFIEDKKLNYHRGNAIKYISRAGIKSKETEIQDLEKAAWYINREIGRLRKEVK